MTTTVNIRALNVAAQNRTGAVWSAVWVEALGANLPSEIAQKLADAAQQAAARTYELGAQAA